MRDDKQSRNNGNYKKSNRNIKKKIDTDLIWDVGYLDEQVKTKITEVKKLMIYQNRIRSLARNEELTIHHLKIDTKDYTDFLSQTKTFEIRKNDREPKYKEGQFVFLNFMNHSYYIGVSMLYEINYVLENVDGLQDDYVILGIRRVFVYRGEVEKV